MRKVTVKWLAGRRIEAISETPKTVPSEIANHLYAAEYVSWYWDGVKHAFAEIRLSETGEVVMYRHRVDRGPSMPIYEVRNPEEYGPFEKFWMTRLLALTGSAI